MTDFYNKVFFYCWDADQENADRDRQLEDDFMEVLINTLHQIGGLVRNQFLEWFEGDVGEGGVVRFDLQRVYIGDAHIAGKKNRILLALLPEYGRVEQDGGAVVWGFLGCSFFGLGLPCEFGGYERSQVRHQLVNLSGPSSLCLHCGSCAIQSGSCTVQSESSEVRARASDVNINRAVDLYRICALI